MKNKNFFSKALSPFVPALFSVLTLSLYSCVSHAGTESAKVPAAVETQDLGVPGTVKDRDALYEHLQEFDGVGLTVARDRSYRPEEVLVKLHSWLGEYKGLRRENIEGHDALVLNRLPDEVLAGLMGDTFPDDFKSGFEIMQSAFWRVVQGALSQGIRIGFLEPDPLFKVSGVFFPDRKLILVDVFASEGTLSHEIRHYHQNLRLLKREADAEAFRYNEDDAPLGNDCITQASRFFAELDATTFELPVWQGVFETLETSPAWHKTAKQGDLDPVRFPQISLLQDNLDYPGMAAEWLRDADCPKELMDVVNQIKRSTDQTATRITSEYAQKLFLLRMEDLHDWSYENSRCTPTGAADPTIAPVCEQRSSRIALIPEDSKNIATAIDDLIVAESSSRPALIRQLLSTLSDSMQKQLCRHAQGFEFLSDCETYFVENY